METLIAYCSIFIMIVTTIIVYFKFKYQYWTRRGIPSLETYIPFGTMRNPITDKISLQELLQEQYNICKNSGWRYVGSYIFTVPQLLVVDPQIIKCMLTKDFNHFMERGMYNEEDDPLSMHLFSLGTSRWKRLRPKLTPTFTSGKMKMMFDIVVTCGYQLEKSMQTICAKGAIDIKEVLECFTMDVIGSCAFGIDCNSFTDPSSEFCRYSKRIFSPTRLENVIGLFVYVFPSVAKTLHLKGIPKDITEFFFNIVTRSVQYRRETGLVRKDFLQILMELADEQTNDPISFNELVAQVFVFFIAGFETSSTTMAFCLLELCVDPSMQDKLRDEVNSVLRRHNSALTYQNLKELKYMNAVIDETLRKYPPVPMLHRECIKDYQLPHTNITIKKGTKVGIPLIGLQNDPDYFPEPGKFNPDRFADRNKDLFAPYTFMPFGEGPRACIGIRFGMMQTKVGLSILLKHYKFTLAEKMSVPVRFKARSFMTAAEGGIWLNATRI
uniref:Cytochrome P450 n=2 Tax=Photinus pyralis TaxID=7054 RepID=A0A1Y1LIW7_PHOPY